MPILFVLESPGKVKNVQKYLGDDYIVSASVGHIRTLGTDTTLGIEMENQFKPTYCVDPKKADVISKLKSQSKKTECVYLAADWDREGEAIAWHVKEVLGLGESDYKRIRFREITKPAIEAAIAEPGQMDMNMVNSQQARTILDKIIGFKVSPCLWAEFRNYKLSAGRVQSVAVRMIVEREMEIEKFVSKTFYCPIAGFSLVPTADHTDLTAECDTQIEDVNEVSNIINNTDSGLVTYWIDDLKKTKSKRSPPAPFITSSLQQEASNKLGMSPDECMGHAQKLYEAGLITYMRTDSYNLSKEAQESINQYIKTEYGDKYTGTSTAKSGKKAKGAQEAHEAIRPTNVATKNISGQAARAIRLYNMIWKRTVASRMTPAEVEIKTAKIRMDTSECNPKIKDKYIFVSKLEKILFEGYLKVYDLGPDGEPGEGDELTDNQRLEQLFNRLQIGSQVWCSEMTAKEKETKPANGRFTEAGLIKKLEDEKIGRPSTYASIVSKIKEKKYVEMKTIQAKPREFKVLGFKYPDILTVTTETRNTAGENNKLFPTGLGTMTCTFLVKTFQKMMDYKFTAEVESLLDNIAAGEVEWYAVVTSVWDYLHPIIDRLGSSIKKNSSTGKRELGSHPDTGLEICVIKTRYGWAICESNPDKAKSRWASLGVRDPNTIDLETAVSLLVYPKQLGMYNNKSVELCLGKSHYIKYDDKNYSIDIYNKTVDVPTTGKRKKDTKESNTIQDPSAIDLATAKKIIDTCLKSKAETADTSQIPVFEGVKDYKISKGQYGYYIKYLETYNVPLPTEYKKDVSSLTKEDADSAIKAYLTKNKKASGNSTASKSTTDEAKPKPKRVYKKKTT